MGTREQRIIQSLCVHLALGAGLIDLDEACKLLEVDKTSLKVKRRQALEFAQEVLKPLKKRLC